MGICFLKGQNTYVYKYFLSTRLKERFKELMFMKIKYNLG